MRRLVVLSVLFGFTGCVTPSIPIPPPDPAKMVFTVGTDPGGVIVSASLTYPSTESYHGGVVYVFNRDKGRGIIELVNADNTIGPTMPVPASANDPLVISVEASEQTVSTCVLLREGTPASYCP
jgi:hypothetical protein